MTTDLLEPPAGLRATTGGGLARVRLCAVTPDGLLHVESPTGEQHWCEVLDECAAAALTWAAGDQLLAVLPVGASPGCVVGRIGRARRAASPATLVVEATQTLKLRCGEASIDLRADGKVMIRGDDVLVRAKGTQRIRAGTVAIN